MRHSFRPKPIVAALWTAFALQLPVAFAADITNTPPSGSGFVVKDNTGVTDRFRVQETGTVTIPGLPTGSTANTVTCFDSASGRLGPCATGASATLGVFGTGTNSANVGGGGAQCTLGEVTLTAATVYGANHLKADGSLLQISQNTALFSLLGTNFGGNGSTTFALPNLTSAAPNGLTYIICALGVYP